MKTSFLPAAWRKTLALPLPLISPPSRGGRRVLRLDQLLAGERGARGCRSEGGEDASAPFDGSWHESSRALARGLQVREWGSAESVPERMSAR